jgi:hypothetical protein
VTAKLSVGGWMAFWSTPICVYCADSVMSGKRWRLARAMAASALARW